MGPAEVEERYGIPPAAVPDFIALRGDPSDGLPGAKGIGEKTAADLLRRHGTLEAVIAGAVREKPSVRRALIEQADELRAFKDIATLRDAESSARPTRDRRRGRRRAAGRAGHGAARGAARGAGSGGLNEVRAERALGALEQVAREVAAPVDGTHRRAGRLTHAPGDDVRPGAIGVGQQREQVTAVPGDEEVGAAQQGGQLTGLGAAHEQHAELLPVADGAGDHAPQHPAASGAGSGPIKSSRSMTEATARTPRT